MNNFIISIMTIGLAFSIPSFSHEGHDKNIAGEPAPNGGILRGNKKLHAEVLKQSGGFKLFVYNHEVKPIALKDIKVEATYKLPKKSKHEPIKLEVEGEAYVGKVDAKGAHRYSLEVSVEFEGKKNKFKYNIEP